MGLRIPALLSMVATAFFYHGRFSQCLPLFFGITFGLQVAHFFYHTFFYPYYRSPLRFLPGPNDGHLILGQTLNFIRADSANDLPLSFMRRFLDAPLIRYIHFGGSEWILVNSVQAVKEIYQFKCYDFIKPKYFRRIAGEIAGIGLVNAEGDVHQQERKFMNGAFKLSNIKKLVPVFSTKARALSYSIEEVLSGKPLDAINVCDLFQKSTFSVISLATLGIEATALDTSCMPFSDLYRSIMDLDPAGITLSLINTFIPIRWVPIKANRDFLGANKEARRLLRGTIRSRIAEIQGIACGTPLETTKNQFTEEGSQDLLTFMLYERGTGENRWSEAEILGHLLNFMSAGHETTATALTWAALTLCLQPSIQSRLRREILISIPHNDSPSFTELESLPYLAAFTKEVLRCFSPITFNARTPAKDTIVCNTIIPAGTTILINPQVLNFHPLTWGPDAEKFDPDRHLPDDNRGKPFPLSRDPFSMASFGFGPRICIGKTFGLLQIKSMLVELLRKFELRRGWDEAGKPLPAGQEFVQQEGVREDDIFGGVEVKNYMHLKPKAGVWVRFKPLSS